MEDSHEYNRDSRDSRGYNAKYFTYSFLDNHQIILQDWY